MTMPSECENCKRLEASLAELEALLRDATEAYRKHIRDLTLTGEDERSMAFRRAWHNLAMNYEQRALSAERVVERMAEDERNTLAELERLRKIIMQFAPQAEG